ncbi:DUF1513 domain-containing protein [Loktanella sp. D2R18]|uniref:DUF1513 domain-containing protein n=1 Tax=Rhodobacterales TaxID=204455 RepID=UPI000DE9186A|nr:MULTISPECIES: DUF1513 domain-containing protein [Rhodobacterales]MDO6588811.1 DUF1513 domain-containing protein [Yoonia sp. 1_MG-2023]RBW42362.1 DUF1513 domain-containing protein [Loktanella sp. D2R18]
MTSRRQFLAGLLATGLVPKPTWADAGSPQYLSAGALSDGSYVLCGIGAPNDVLFQIPLPARGHAAAAHPTRPEAVAFARRPGTFAIVIDCATGMEKSNMAAPEGRHFYGHGAFSADGHWLFTTENDFEAGQGRVGVWDVQAGYRRVDEFASGGVGPHEIKRMPGTNTLVIANGGIDTHPDSGRTKLNIATMEPNLTYIQDGQIVDSVALSHDLHKNSIRHIDIADGQVAFGMQWQGDGEQNVLAGLHRQGGAINLLTAPTAQSRQMRGYVGSIAFSRGGKHIALTSPVGGVTQVYDVATNMLSHQFIAPDAGGVAARGAGFIITNGQGQLGQIDQGALHIGAGVSLAWDNHIVPVGV